MIWISVVRMSDEDATAQDCSHMLSLFSSFSLSIHQKKRISQLVSSPPFPFAFKSLQLYHTLQ